MTKGISQLKLAMELNTNQNTISRYETGDREPGIQELIKIADYFDVSLDYLLERTDDPRWQKPPISGEGRRGAFVPKS